MIFTKKILVIDDDANMRSAMKRMIKEYQSDIDVIGAEKGEDALRAVEMYNPELIFLDLMMPGINGLQVLNSLKKNKNKAISGIPVVMLTAIGNNEIVFKAKKMGAVDYITKPFNEKVFLLKIKKYLQLSKKYT